MISQRSLAVNINHTRLNLTSLRCMSSSLFLLSKVVYSCMRYCRKVIFSIIFWAFLPVIVYFALFAFATKGVGMLFRHVTIVIPGSRPLSIITYNLHLTDNRRREKQRNTAFHTFYTRSRDWWKEKRQTIYTLRQHSVLKGKIVKYVKKKKKRSIRFRFTPKTITNHNTTIRDGFCDKLQ